MRFITSAYSFSIFSISSEVRRWSCRSSTASAWRSLMAKVCIRPSRARYARAALADELDHRVEVVQRDAIAFQDMRAVALLLQLEFGAPGDHHAAMLEELREQIEHGQRARFRLAVHLDDADHIDS